MPTHFPAPALSWGRLRAVRTRSVAPLWWQEGKDTKARRKIVASADLQKNGFRRVIEITELSRAAGQRG